MNNSRPIEPSTGISLGDIYFVLFRHKWKIILLSLAGFAAAAAVYFFEPPLYHSQAELLIKYVPAATQLTLAGDNQRVLVPDSSGNDIINSEIQILTSLDLAEEAVTNIGASNILVGAGSAANPISAAVFVRNNLQAAPADKGGSVIVVTFSSPNPQMVQPVLQEIITDYLQKNYEIHSAGGQFEDALTMEQSALSVKLNATAQQLADLKNKANIISLDDSRKDLADQISKIRGNIWEAQAELSGYEAAMKQMEGSQSLKQKATNAPPVVPPDQVDAYNSLCANLDALRKKEQGYWVQGFAKSNALMQEVEGQIAGAEKTKTDLEKKYPQIAHLAAGAPASSAAAPATDAQTEITQVTSLQAKIKAWDEQLNALQVQATNLNNLAPSISQLEQAQAIQQANYQNLSVSLERSHIDQALDTGKSPNIKWVQTPTPPSQDWTKTYKKIAMLAFGGILAGLALAFLTELYLDRTVKRPSEVEAKLKLPLFLSIPDVSRNGHARRLPAPPPRQLRLENAEDGDKPAPDGGLEVALLEQNPALQSYCEALRDRLIAYFDVKGLTHKPKLVAVTSADRRAGVSTLAAGLAASFSATGDGNVLLVDMNLENGAAQQFYKGEAVCGLDAALQSETKGDALVQENLYVVNGTGNSKNDDLPRVLPKRFAGLVPKFKASEYDYIIFDLPPVSQTSVTPRVARFMDMVLLAIESEKTDRDIVRRASDQLVEFGGTVGAVLNKTRKYVPNRLHQELPGEK
jgi:uncharacterized protein involved in exopolysaccharide biosynthesis/Mrp family chromosome partitioning ATPase